MKNDSLRKEISEVYRCHVQMNYWQRPNECCLLHILLRDSFMEKAMILYEINLRGCFHLYREGPISNRRMGRFVRCHYLVISNLQKTKRSQYLDEVTPNQYASTKYLSQFSDNEYDEEC